MPGGSPTLYKPEYCQKLVEHLAEGYLYESFAALVDVHWDTLYDWEARHPEFLEAKKKGLTKALLYDEQLLKAGLLGTKKVKNGRGKIVDIHIQPALMIFRLKNRYRRFYQEKPLEEGKDLTPKKKNKLKTYTQFCVDAGYPEPFKKQIEMKDFILKVSGVKMLMGSRGYGKTEYITTLGIAYELYLAWHSGKISDETNLIMTQSQSRNKAILREIARACECQGMTFKVKNTDDLFLDGNVGINANVGAVTVETCSLRGRHPKRVIFDDPVTPTTVTAPKREKLKIIYDEVVGKICKDIGIIGQPVHLDDLYSNIRESVNLMEVPYGEIPELDADLEAQRIAGVDESSILKSYYLKIPKESESIFGNIKHADTYPAGDSVAFLDPSFEGGDLTALTIMRAFMESIHVVGFAWKRAWNNCIDEVEKEVKRFHVKRLCFETNSLGDLPLDLLRQSLPCAVVGKKSVTNKHATIMNAGTFSHMIHLSRQSHKIYIDSIVKYEAKYKPADPADSLARCLEWMGLIKGGKR